MLFCFSQLCVCCRFRHASDALVSLHAFFPFLSTKLLHCDTADSTGIQTVRGNTWRENGSNKGELIDVHLNIIYRSTDAKHWKLRVIIQQRPFISHCERHVSIFYKYNKYTALKSRLGWLVWSKHSRVWSKQQGDEIGLQHMRMV